MKHKEKKPIKMVTETTISQCDCTYFVLEKNTSKGSQKTQSLLFNCEVCGYVKVLTRLPTSCHS